MPTTYAAVRKSGCRRKTGPSWAHTATLSNCANAMAQKAFKRIVSTGATLRMQGPLIRHINEDPASWSSCGPPRALGAILTTVRQRDNGPSGIFAAAGARARYLPGGVPMCLPSRTVRGPSMSAFPGKVVIDGVVTINGEKLFALQFLQARNPDWVRKPFFAKYDETATWMDHLVPAFGKSKFFFEGADEGAVQAPSAKVIPIRTAQRADAGRCRQ